MSNNEHNGAPDGTQAAQDDEFQDVGGPEATPEAEILPPEHAPTISWGAVEVTEEARAVNDLSLSWRHMTDDERLETIEGEMVLTVRSKRNLEDWIVIGRACLHLKHEVEEQGGASSGRNYNLAWRRLVPPNLQDLTADTRTRAIWIWDNREVLREWWSIVRPRDRQRWNYPSSIQEAFRRARSFGVPDRTPEGEEEHLPRRGDTAADRRSNRMSIADMLQQNQATLDEMREVARQFGGDNALIYDLRPEYVHESADNFRQVYGGLDEGAEEAVTQFGQALLDNAPNEAEWVPGSDFDNDSDDEVARYRYNRDPEREARIARKVLALWLADRQRSEPPAPEPPARPVMRRTAPEPEAASNANVVRMRRGN